MLEIIQSSQKFASDLLDPNGVTELPQPQLCLNKPSDNVDMQIDSIQELNIASVATVLIRKLLTAIRVLLFK